MTREQAIVLGFIAAAFVAGWLSAALTSALAGRGARRGADQPQSLVEEVADALQDDLANDSMLSVFAARGATPLRESELDLADWGFTYGVAWARARDQRAGGTPEEVAAEALRSADQVFRAYTADAEETDHVDETEVRESVPAGPNGAARPRSGLES